MPTQLLTTTAARGEI